MKLHLKEKLRSQDWYKKLIYLDINKIHWGKFFTPFIISESEIKSFFINELYNDKINKFIKNHWAYKKRSELSLMTEKEYTNTILTELNDFLINNIQYIKNRHVKMAIEKNLENFIKNSDVLELIDIIDFSNNFKKQLGAVRKEEEERIANEKTFEAKTAMAVINAQLKGSI